MLLVQAKTTIARADEKLNNAGAFVELVSLLDPSILLAGGIVPELGASPVKFS